MFGKHPKQDFRPLIPRRRILMVDDEALFTKWTKRNIEAAGPYDVRTENHARNTLAAAREFHPDLILLDVMMPDGDGGTIAAELLADPKLSHIPILFLTGALRASEISGGYKQIGGRRYLAKPIKTRELLRHIEELLPDSEEPTPGKG